MKKLLVASLVALLSLPLICQANPRRLTIATAGTAGALYPMGVALAQVITQKAPGFAASAEASAGSLENLRNLARGQVEWGISQNEVAQMAHAGQDQWKGRPIKGLRSLFGTLVSWVQIFAPADSPVKGVADLAGRKVGVGAPGSGGEQAARRVLAFHGLTYDKIQAQFMSNRDMVAALKDGALDAFIITHPLRSAALMDLTTGFKVKMLPVADPAFYKKHPYYSRRTIPAGTYQGVDQAVETPTSRIVMYTSTQAGLSPDEVHDLLAVIWQNAEAWTKVHPAVKAHTSLAQALEGVRVPLHPGAARFYREKGLNIPADLLP